jgi:hypothetical protein
MSSHYDKAMTKLTSKEKAAVLTRGLRLALEQGIARLKEHDPQWCALLGGKLNASEDLEEALDEVLHEASRARAVDAQNQVLLKRLQALEAQLSPGAAKA